MILYHTSQLVINKPDVSYSRNNLDFGRGFYLTSLKEQAVLYGQRFIKRGENAFLNTYELDENIKGCRYKIFSTYNSEWLDYITACRKGLQCEVYDIIEGGIADDQVFNTLDLYLSGIYTKEQALDQLKYKKTNHQVCITSQDILDNHLHFVSSEKL
ncbi:MAG: DUF3990 domain-containing protein [Paludibacteraceae bacterium]|nr:DUF3990 domain-containing protein [Paludibacteraceae bacterium]